MAEISPITVARFWSKVQVQQSRKVCWEWQGARCREGYGNFKVPELGHRMNFGAHRIAYRLTNGKFPDEGGVVRHKCDNPRCVNPFHLEEGTKSDNAMDMVVRGRQVLSDQAGENNGNAKLSSVDVAFIKREIERGETNVALAAKYGVTHQLISRIRRGHSWK